ncbi:MAG: SpoIIE family protein phosphatase [Spirochaetales bacterium]|nr:SpoIIE family protein phosphatase [Spirochaetales bacterium]
MLSFEPEEMQALANELNLLFFVTDETLIQWSWPSSALLRMLNMRESEFTHNPATWIHRCTRSDREFFDSLEKLSAYDGDIKVTIPFLRHENDVIHVTLRLSSPVKRSTGEVLRFGSAEVRRDDAVYKKEALKSRDSEVEISARIQRTLLTGNITSYFDGMEIAAETLPSRLVDGDFYELQPLEPGVTDFIIGDVVGKGVPAALLGAGFKAAYYKSLITSSVSGTGWAGLDRVLNHMDSLISGKLVDLGKFLTFYYCRINLKDSTLSFVDAGHTSFIYYDSSEQRSWSVKGANMPMGFTTEQVYKIFRLPLNPGDLLFFYSDGISEVMNSEGQIFGCERVLRLVNAHNYMTPEELLSRVLFVTFFYAAEEFKDDVTGVAIRIKGNSGFTATERSFTFSVSEPANLEDIRETFLKDLSDRCRGSNEKSRTKLAIALVEACSNCISYSRNEIRLKWKIQDASAEIRLDFEGPDFNWHEVKDPEITDYQQNGYGSFLIDAGSDSSLLLKGINDKKELVIFKEF